MESLRRARKSDFLSFAVLFSEEVVDYNDCYGKSIQARAEIIWHKKLRIISAILRQFMLGQKLRRSGFLRWPGTIYANRETIISLSEFFIRLLNRL